MWETENFERKSTSWPLASIVSACPLSASPARGLSDSLGDASHYALAPSFEGDICRLWPGVIKVVLGMQCTLIFNELSEHRAAYFLHASLASLTLAHAQKQSENTTELGAALLL